MSARTLRITMIVLTALGLAVASYQRRNLSGEQPPRDRVARKCGQSR